MSSDQKLLTIHVYPSALQKSRGLLRLGPFVIPCALGRTGVTRHKREGDGATPAGLLTLETAYIRRDRWKRVPCSLRTRTIQRNLGWSDDPQSRAYNRPILLPTPESHEKMWRDDGLYDIVIETGWNRRPAIRRRGSAIFIHLARPGFLPTEGCIAIERAALRLLLPRLNRQTRLFVH